MTIPLVTASHKKVETSAKLKKFYNMLDEAVTMAENDFNATTDKWDYSSSGGNTFFNTYIKDYIKYSQIVTDTNSGVTKFPGINLNTSWPIIILDDGIKFEIGGTYTAASVPFRRVYVDINGEQKPNTYGRDIFIFTIPKKGTTSSGMNTDHTFVYPSALGQSRTTLINNCKSCSSDTNGLYCLALIKNDGWEIKDDYPCKI